MSERPLHDFIDMEAYDVVAGETYRDLLALARNLFQMIPPQVWKDSGGDDGQGHYEGLYRAAQIQERLFPEYHAALEKKT